MIKKNKEIMQFKITLNDSKPKIWRRIQVPADYTFFDLYCAIEDAMGWGGGHLHAFYVEGKGSKDRMVIEFPNPEAGDSTYIKTHDERKEKIADYFGKICKQCVYCYDMGDSWDHTVIFEHIVPMETRVRYPRCVAGENARPPDDCGGVWGYGDLQKIIQNPRHPEHVEMMEWLGIDDPKDFDPSRFDLSEVGFSNPRRRLKEWNEGFRI